MIVTEEMVEAFGKAWGSTPKGEPGDRRRAGLKAALAAAPRQRFLTNDTEKIAIPLAFVLAKDVKLWFVYNPVDDSLRIQTEYTTIESPSIGTLER